MKRVFAILAVMTAFTAFKPSPASAQVQVSVNIGIQPAWGPVGYDYAEYYYLPDIDIYYYVPTQMYVYFDFGRWIHTRYLPARYHYYDFYRGYKVVINHRDPWRYHRRHIREYSHYRNNYTQVVWRDRDRNHRYDIHGNSRPAPRREYVGRDNDRPGWNNNSRPDRNNNAVRPRPDRNNNGRPDRDNNGNRPNQPRPDWNISRPSQPRPDRNDNNVTRPSQPRPEWNNNRPQRDRNQNANRPSQPRPDRNISRPQQQRPDRNNSIGRPAPRREFQQSNGNNRGNSERRFARETSRGNGRDKK